MEDDFLPQRRNSIAEHDNNTLCGIGSWTPQYLQKFASPKLYLLFFCSTGIIQGVYFSYLIGVLSTLEKRYSFDSWISGIILIADNISPLIFSVIVGYYGRYIHRPRLVAFGMMVNVICCFLSCLPYLLFGSEIKPFQISSKNLELCSVSLHPEECDRRLISESVIAISIFFIANFLKGFGSTAYYSIGTPYLDDSVKKKNSPLYLGATFAVRIIGPTLGFMLSSFCLKFYENPFIEPDFDINDSQWIGAWWIGFLIIGVLLFLTSFPFLFFPRYLPSGSKMKTENALNHSLSDLLLSLRNLIQNPILMFHTLALTFQINGLFGYFVFMPKYIEKQYHNSASSASLFSGTITLSATVPSALLGGFCISRFKPRPKILTGYILFVHVFSGIVMVAALFMNCSTSAVSENESLLYYEEQSCNSMCSCSKSNFNPVCDINGNTHFSACSAGCYVRQNTGKVVAFKNCSCISSASNYTSEEIQASKGICSEDCYKFLPYIIIITVSKIFGSTARVGNILVTLRCVDEIDKTLALGAVEFFISVFATIPYPLLYGHVIDKSCLLWEETCEYKGKCFIYDNDLFRYYLHGLSIFFIFLGACCDFVVFLLSPRMKELYDDSKSNAHQNELIEIKDTNDAS